MRYDFCKNNGTVKKRIICFIMGLVLMLASVVPAGLDIFAKESGSAYRHMSFELHPDEEDMDKTVTLDGLMPKNASAEVIDVTDDFINDEYFNATPSDSEREEKLENAEISAVAMPHESDDEKGMSAADQAVNNSEDNYTEKSDENAGSELAQATSGDAYSEEYYEDDNDSEDAGVATGSDADEYKDEYSDATSGDAESNDGDDQNDVKDTDENIEDENRDASEDSGSVTNRYVTIAAYDITIKVGKKEYQPTEKRPIRVEIADARIKADKTILLYHIKDDGEREEITDITVEDGKVSFDATGFSVYEIVKVSTSGETINATSIDQLDGNGFYIYNDRVTAGTAKYLLNTTASSNQIQTTTDKSAAVLFYFKKIEGTDDKFNIYYLDGEDNPVYMYTQKKDSSGFYFSNVINETDNFVFTAKKSEWGDTFYFRARTSKEPDDKQNYWYFGGTNLTTNRQFTNGDIDTKNNTASVLVRKSENDDKNTLFSLTFPSNDSGIGDSLDGKTYGLMNYTGGTHGYALMADSTVHSLVELVTHPSKTSDGITLYVDEGSEVTRWTFHSQTNGKYTLSAAVGSETKYLAADGDNLTLTSSADAAAEFDVIPGSDNKLQFKTGGKYITFTSNDSGEETVNSFVLSTSTSANTQLNLIDFATLTDKDYISYSADRVSVSDVENGDKVIVYTRIWNETTLKYDIYAIDYNGTLYPCYASGGKILWLGDGTCSLEWEFKEYLDEVTKQPSYYYELYNPYSEKYIYPQLSSDQILNDTGMGINMPGRRNGEFYTNIIAWDDTRYAYIGMKPDENNKKLVPCAESVSVPFYFATLEDLNLTGELHPVDTVDNNDYGIIMKMQDFSDRATMSNFLETNVGGAVTTVDANILSTKLGDDGYPTIVKDDGNGVKNTGKSLGELYNEPVTVNHLFIESIHKSSGYFEFDSCQNTATLVKEDGTIGDQFTVYRELATDDLGSSYMNGITHKHGQFFPYNTIKEGEFAKIHTQNLYDSLQNELPDRDPRKYEKMYLLQFTGTQPNCYNGMELEASFVQTVSGLDAWGHDIIFEFTGDDDFWLYVDGELIIDLGGIHSALEGNVNFRTGKVYVKGVTKTLKQIFKENFTARYKASHNNAAPSEAEIKEYLSNYFQPDANQEDGFEDIFKDYTKHTMRIFYMERGAGASNLHMRFNIASVTPGHVVVSKSISGSGAELLDTDFIEYPFQIYYTLPDGPNGEPGEEHLLKNNDVYVGVSYQNSNQPVTFVERYRPPGFNEDQAYENIYFINPAKNAEISFPDGTINYRIVECAVDSTVYGSVKINGEDVPSERVEIRGDLKSYSSEMVTAELRPTISFDNIVNDNVIKDLYITKKLVDKNGNEITDDTATFSFRLYLSSVMEENFDFDKMQLVDMHNYYIVKGTGAVKYFCRHDHVNGGFIQTELRYTRENIAKLKEGPVDGIKEEDVTFTTSSYGAIAGIPSGYTICVPGLPVGTVFKVTEDDKSGYGLDHYEMVEGDRVEGGQSQKINSYELFTNKGQLENVGRVVAEENPQMEVINKRGYGLTVNKKWSDIELTTGHDPIFVAIFVDGELLADSVRRIVSPSTRVYYFWESLEKNTDGTNRVNLDGYVTKEVKITGNVTVDGNGVVTGYDEVIPYETDGEHLCIFATRTAAATPEGEDPEHDYDYIVSYTQGENNGSTRTDTITNTREGGLAMRLFKWNSTDPLAGGKFTLTDETGAIIGKYTSGADGLINMLYTFEHDKMYTLTETMSPKGYVGLSKALKFKVNTDDSVSLFYEDGVTPWGDTDIKDEDWAKWKTGAHGITAYVDIYNKPFNLKIAKMDSTDTSIMLGSAHFALYKQSNTTISGYVKNKDPLTGFEDMVTVNGEVDVCGGNSGRVINPGENGAVFFLTETEAPPNYTKLDSDVIFRVSALGVPTLISDSYNGQIVETEDSYIYTLSVPNTKEDSTKLMLSITKFVKGNWGNKNLDFTFIFSIEGDDGMTGYEWTKNGEDQVPIHSGEDFTLGNADSVMLVLPKDARVTITEKEDDNSKKYSTTFKLGTAEAVSGKSLTFDFAADSSLVVTNTRSGIIPTGVETHVFTLLGIAMMLSASMFIFFRGRHKRYEEE